MTPTPTASTISLHYEIVGTGKPILFLHGLGASLYTWRKMVPGLQSDYKLVLVDLKGFGESPKPLDDKYSIGDQVQLVYQLIRELDLKDLVVVGNSYGGGVTLFLAILLGEVDPKRLSKLILIDTAAYDESLPWYVQLLRTPIIGWLVLNLSPSRMLAKSILDYAYFNDRLVEPSQIEAYAAPLRMPNGKYALLKTAQQVIPPDFHKITEKYKTIKIPTLIIWGYDDKVIPLRLGQKLDAAMPMSELVTINDTGHIPQEETPAPTLALIKSFLTT